MNLHGFRIHKPKQSSHSFSTIRSEIVRIADMAKRNADKTGNATSQLIVFSEVALKYLFTIDKQTVIREIEKSQKVLPSDLWIGIAFSVFQRSEPLGLRNTGYLFSKDKLRITPKRLCTHFDENAISKFCDRFVCEASELNWVSDGNAMEKQDVPFQYINSPNGTAIEVRVCFDVTASPLKPEKNRITLVPAYKLDPRYTLALSTRRDFVIVNDGSAYYSKDKNVPSNVIY